MWMSALLTPHLMRGGVDGHFTQLQENDTLILIIEDDGIGCENIKPDFGLHHMQERIALLQGDIRFYGSNGFVILAEIPIREGI